MRVLQVGLGNIGGGLEAFVMNYYRELSKMDVQFDFVCMYGKIAYEKEIKTLGGRIFYVPNVKKNYPKSGITYKAPRWSRSTLKPRRCYSTDLTPRHR